MMLIILGILLAIGGKILTFYIMLWHKTQTFFHIFVRFALPF